MKILKASQLDKAYEDINKKIRYERLIRNPDFASTPIDHAVLVRILNAMGAVRKYQDAESELKRLKIKMDL